MPISSEFLSALEERILIFDGAMGTSIQAKNLTADDFGGKEGCNEYLVLTRPDVIKEIHAGYLAVGCDTIETDTFGGTAIVLGEYDLAEQVYDINRRAAELAREVAYDFSQDGQRRFVAGSMGPGTKLPTLGHIAFRDLKNAYREQARGLLDGGVDLLIIETCQDLLQTKGALIGGFEAMRETGRTVPVVTSVTMETTGTMLLGTEIGAALTMVEAYEEVQVFGLNCATGPTEMVEHVRPMSNYCTKKILVMPNAGLPQMVGGKTHYPLTPEELASYHTLFVEEFGVNIVGGCCGTTPAHLRAVVEAVGSREPKRRTPQFIPAVSSLYTSVPLKQETSFLIIGERLNATGSRKFRRFLMQEDYDGIVGIAREQVREGAHILDVCPAYVGRDEMRDMREIVSRLVTQVTIPLMIDSTEAPVIEEALSLIGGKVIVNSINMEDGEERIKKVLPLVKRYGAAVVAMTIDEEGMAKTAEKKLQVAERIYRIATERYGIPPYDLFFDTLTFTLGSGDEEFRRAGIETIEAIRMIKERLPGVHTSLGVSNISFGLNEEARHVLNSVFLHYAVEAGLDAAIVHAEKIMPLYKIDEEAREVARQLIFDTRRSGYDPLIRLMELFAEEGRSRKKKATDEHPKSVEEALKTRIVDGERPGLERLLDEAMKRYDPLTIINEILLDGMQVVGDLFASGEMQLPFVLQSAEVMKAAVSYLEPFMEKSEGQGRGKIVLATVKGDVHDIGKNLVDIILSNNGYTTYNLGIKQPISHIVEVALKHEADVIGLSGLLVKSTVVMREGLEELNRLGLRFPVLLGGAALTRRYVEEELRPLYKGEVFYAEDAFEGLRLMNRIMGHGKAEGEKGRKGEGERKRKEKQTIEVLSGDGQVRSDVRRDVQIPEIPFYGDQIVEEIPLQEVFRYINEIALFRGQWQFKRGDRGPDDYRAFVEETVRPLFNRWKQLCVEERILEPKVVYGYFFCQSSGNDVIIYHGDRKTEWVRMTFPRQSNGRRLCIADFFAGVESGRMDVIACHIVTVGRKASEVTKRLFEEHKYTDYLYLHGLSVETAEALAEYWHRKIREELGIAGEDAPDIRQIFQQGYRGSRYSFGYPACPNLEDQEKLFVLLKPERIGVTLSEEYQLEPEQSTSAIIVHHPEARYFQIE